MQARTGTQHISVVVIKVVVAESEANTRLYKNTCNFIAMSQSHRESVSRMQRCTVDLCFVIASSLARQHALYSRCFIHFWPVAPCTLQGVAYNTELSCRLTCHETVERRASLPHVGVLIMHCQSSTHGLTKQETQCVTVIGGKHTHA